VESAGTTGAVEAVPDTKGTMPTAAGEPVVESVTTPGIAAGGTCGAGGVAACGAEVTDVPGPGGGVTGAPNPMPGGDFKPSPAAGAEVVDENPPVERLPLLPRAR
jgi:hypothetical protein